MSSLTPSSFSTDQQAAIQDRLDKGAKNILQVQSSIDGLDTLITLLEDTDSANELVQQQAIDDVEAILDAIVAQRDIDEPGEAPHSIVYGATFPATPYSTPVAGKDLTDWELWRTPTPNPPEVDPNQPTGAELTDAYPILVAEFDEFQVFRLHATIGSFVVTTRFVATRSLEAGKLAVIQDRNAFYISIGFTVTP